MANITNSVGLGRKVASSGIVSFALIGASVGILLISNSSSTGAVYSYLYFPDVAGRCGSQKIYGADATVTIDATAHTITVSGLSAGSSVSIITNDRNVS